MFARPRWGGVVSATTMMTTRSSYEAEFVGDSLETSQTSSQDALLAYFPLCSRRLAFLARRHYHERSRPAAAADNAGDAQVQACARNSRNIMQPGSPPSWWGRSKRQDWGSWGGGYCHRLRSAAITALAERPDCSWKWVRPTQPEVLGGRWQECGGE